MTTTSIAQVQLPQPIKRLSFLNKSIGYPSLFALFQIILSIFIVEVGYHLIGHMSIQAQSFHTWDGIRYINIAANGYQANDVPFFPLYPLMIRGMHQLTHLPYNDCAILIAEASFFFSIIFFYKMILTGFDEDIAKRALWLLTAFPAAMFLNVAYTESFTLLTTILFFYLLNRGHWYWPMIVGALATATHDLGAILAFAGLYHLITIRKQLSPQTFWLRFFSLGIIVSGLLAYMIFLQYKFGDPLAFLTYQSTLYQRVLNIPLYNVIKSSISILHIMISHPRVPQLWNIVALINNISTIAIFILGAIMLLQYKHHKLITPELKLFFILTLLAATCSGPYHDSTQTYGRLMVVLFPAFIIWADKLKSPTLLLYTITLMLPFKALLLALFAAGYSII